MILRFQRFGREIERDSKDIRGVDQRADGNAILVYEDGMTSPDELDDPYDVVRTIVEHAKREDAKEGK